MSFETTPLKQTTPEPLETRVENSRRAWQRLGMIVRSIVQIGHGSDIARAFVLSDTLRDDAPEQTDQDQV